MMDKDAVREAEGWQRLTLSDFSASIGPVWLRGEPERREVLLETSPATANGLIGNVHGGALMTFADIALGVVAVDAISEPKMATVQLTYAFAGAVRVGDVVVAQSEVVRRTRRLIFTRALFRVEDRVVGTAEGIFNSFAAEAAATAG